MSRTISKYWLCQIAGWGTYITTYTLLHLILGTPNQPYFLNILFLDAFWGLVTTHFMKLFIKKMFFLEDTVPFQIFDLVLTTLVFSFFYALICTFLATKLKFIDSINQVELVVKFFHALLGAFIFLFIWNIIYFAYNYIIKSKHTAPETFNALIV